MMKKTLAILFATAWLAVTGWNQVVSAQECKIDKHTPIPNLNGLSYHRARARLIAAGWQPYQTISNVPTQQEANLIQYGNGEVFWKRGYRELENCLGTGDAACTFLFADVYKNRLRVITAGEESAKDKVYASVTRWSFVCSQ